MLNLESKADKGGRSATKGRGKAGDHHPKPSICSNKTLHRDPQSAPKPQASRGSPITKKFVRHSVQVPPPVSHSSLDTHCLPPTSHAHATPGRTLQRHVCPRMGAANASSGVPGILGSPSRRISHRCDREDTTNCQQFANPN